MNRERERERKEGCVHTALHDRLLARRCFAREKERNIEERNIRCNGHSNDTKHGDEDGEDAVAALQVAAKDAKVEDGGENEREKRHGKSSDQANDL